MKNLLLSFIFLFVFADTYSQSEKYVKAMQTNLIKMDSAKSGEEFIALSATFERIAEAEKTQWLPYYYASLTQILYAFTQQEVSKNDAIADKAEQLINKADALEKNNSEISCLKSMVATVRMLVNPMQRYMQYGKISNEELENAKKQDTANPRPYYLLSQSIKNTPVQFGGGCDNAKPILETALKKYESFVPASALHPNWGKGQLVLMLKECEAQKK